MMRRIRNADRSKVLRQALDETERLRITSGQADAIRVRYTPEQIESVRRKLHQRRCCWWCGR